MHDSCLPHPWMSHVSLMLDEWQLKYVARTHLRHMDQWYLMGWVMSPRRVTWMSDDSWTSHVLYTSHVSHLINKSHLSRHVYHWNLMDESWLMDKSRLPFLARIHFSGNVDEACLLDVNKSQCELGWELFGDRYIGAWAPSRFSQ